MPYKDPIKARESARLRQQQFRRLHKEDKKYLERRKKENKKCWNKNGDKYKKLHTEWYLENREQQLVKMQKYNQEHKEHLNNLKKEQNKLRRKTDSQFLIKSRLRCLLYNSVKLYGQGAKVEHSKKYGLNLNEIAEQLTKSKPKDFNEKEYHIDHKLPCASFDLSKPEEVKKAFDKSNLQWLPAIENIKKSNKLS
jgi:hypothetical protein